MMNPNEVYHAYTQLTPHEQITALARLAAAITVAARDTYVPQSEDVSDARRLRTFNEFSHQVTQHLYALIAGRSDRYPDDVFINTVCAFADETRSQYLLSKLVPDQSKARITRQVG